MSSWGNKDTKDIVDLEDRVELIDDTVEARAAFGDNFGAFEFRLTREQVEGVLAGQVVAFDINGKEYTGFISLKK